MLRLPWPDTRSRVTEVRSPIMVSGTASCKWPSAHDGAMRGGSMAEPRTRQIAKLRSGATDQFDVAYATSNWSIRDGRSFSGSSAKRPPPYIRLFLLLRDARVASVSRDYRKGVNKGRPVRRRGG